MIVNRGLMCYRSSYMDEKIRQRLLKMTRFILRYEVRSNQSFAIYKRTVDAFMHQLEDVLNQLTNK